MIQELDFLVAEKIMGWRDESIASRADIGKPPFTDDEWTDVLNTNLPFTRFSRDIAAAWQVVEKMRGNGWKILIGSDTPIGYTGEKGWSAEFRKDDKWFEVTSPVLANSICAAALKAVVVIQGEVLR